MRDYLVMKTGEERYARLPFICGTFSLKSRDRSEQVVGIAEITPEKQTLWSYAAPQGTEIHTIQPIGRQHVLFVQDGKPLLKPLGLMEHCDKDRRYTKIDLKYVNCSPK